MIHVRFGIDTSKDRTEPILSINRIRNLRIIKDSQFRRRILLCSTTILNCKPLSSQMVRNNGYNIPSNIKTLAYTLINESPTHKIPKTKEIKTVRDSAGI